MVPDHSLHLFERLNNFDRLIKLFGVFRGTDLAIRGLPFERLQLFKLVLVLSFRWFLRVTFILNFNLFTQILLPLFNFELSELGINLKFVFIRDNSWVLSVNFRLVIIQNLGNAVRFVRRSQSLLIVIVTTLGLSYFWRDLLEFTQKVAVSLFQRIFVCSNEVWNQVWFFILLILKIVI